MTFKDGDVVLDFVVSQVDFITCLVETSHENVTVKRPEEEAYRLMAKVGLEIFLFTDSETRT